MSGNGGTGHGDSVGARDSAVLFDQQYVWPGDLTRIPDWVYTDQDIYEREVERIFHGRTWNYVALEAEMPERRAISSAPTSARRRWWWRAPRTARSTCSRTAARIAPPNSAASSAATPRSSSAPTTSGPTTSRAISSACRSGAASPARAACRRTSSWQSHGLRKLNVTTHRGVVFASYARRHGTVRRLSRARGAARVRGDLRRPQAQGARPLPPLAAGQLEALPREPEGPLSRHAAAHVPGDVRAAGRRQPLADADRHERPARRDGVGQVGREGRVQRHQEGDARLQGGHDAARAALHGFRRRSSTARGR